MASRTQAYLSFQYALFSPQSQMPPQGCLRFAATSCAGGVWLRPRKTIARDCFHVLHIAGPPNPPAAPKGANHLSERRGPGPVKPARTPADQSRIVVGPCATPPNKKRPRGPFSLCSARPGWPGPASAPPPQPRRRRRVSPRPPSAASSSKPAAGTGTGVAVTKFCLPVWLSRKVRFHICGPLLASKAEAAAR